MLKPFFIYILLHTTTAMEYGYEKGLDDKPEFGNYGRLSKANRLDHILSNLQTLFKERPSENDVSSGDYNEFITGEETGDNIKFDAVLNEVTNALDKVKKGLLQFNNDGFLTSKTEEKRYKRDVSNETVTYATISENDVTQNNVTSMEIPETVIEEVDDAKVINETIVTEALNTNNETEKNESRRRMMSDEYISSPTSRVKDKLLLYLEDIFNEFERKIRPLTNIKIALSNNDHYRIGYIIASIDTLEVNLKKLKADMNLHHRYWDDVKILDVFDRIKATNSVASTLIDTLKKYLQ